MGCHISRPFSFLLNIWGPLCMHIVGKSPCPEEFTVQPGQNRHRVREEEANIHHYLAQCLSISNIVHTWEKKCIPSRIKAKPLLLPRENWSTFHVTRSKLMLKYPLHKNWPGLVAISLTREYSQWLAGCCWYLTARDPTQGPHAVVLRSPAGSINSSHWHRWLSFQLHVFRGPPGDGQQGGEKP